MKLYFYIFLLLVIIITAFIIPRHTEHYKNELDPDLPENNCYDFITKDLRWEIDYDLDKHLPTGLITPHYKNEERQKLLDARKTVLQKLDSVKAKSYSNINLDYMYTRACALKKHRMTSNLSATDNCTFNGKILRYDLDPTHGKYGRRASNDAQVESKTFSNYVKSPGLHINNEDDLRSQFTPNEGCFIDTYNKELFFDTITQMAKMSIFENEDKKNYLDSETNRLNERISKLNNTLQLYGIDPKADYSATLVPNCSARTTTYNDDGGGKYNYLDRHNVQCGDDEILSGFKMNTQNGVINYDYKCCQPKTLDNHIKPKMEEKKETPQHQSDKDFQKIWDSKHSLECDGYINSMNLNVEKKSRINYDKYNYTCSKMHKDFSKDRRKLDVVCEDKSTKFMPTNNGIYNLQYMNVECEDGAGIKDLKMVKQGNTFGYNYKCCKPYIKLLSREIKEDDFSLNSLE